MNLWRPEWTRLTARRSTLIKIPSSVLFLALFFSHCYGTVLVPTAGSWFGAPPASFVQGIPFQVLFVAYCLGVSCPNTVGTSLFSSFPMVWGTPWSKYRWKIFCAHALFVPYRLGSTCPDTLLWGESFCSNVFRRLDLFACLPCWHGFVMFLVRGLCSVYLAFTLAMGTPSLVSIPSLIFAPFEESSSSYPCHVEGFFLELLSRMPYFISGHPLECFLYATSVLRLLPLFI